MCSLNVCPRSRVENVTFFMKVLVGPVESVWNCGRQGFENGKLW
jgi:hypothetical protein